MRKIEVFIKTPFNTYIKAECDFDETDQHLFLDDDNDLNGKRVDIDLGLVIKEDIKSITQDVVKRKKENPENDYSSYDVNDIRLEKVLIKDGRVTCGYSINAGEYRRVCVGITSETPIDMYPGRYTLTPPIYQGKVCW